MMKCTEHCMTVTKAGSVLLSDSHPANCCSIHSCLPCPCRLVCGMDQLLKATLAQPPQR